MDEDKSESRFEKEDIVLHVTKDQDENEQSFIGRVVAVGWRAYHQDYVYLYRVLWTKFQNGLWVKHPRPETGSGFENELQKAVEPDANQGSNEAAS